MMKVLIISLLLAGLSQAQTYKVNGFLFDDETGNPLSYGSVRIDGTTTGTAANFDGQFSLSLKSGNYKLIFTYVGYKSDTLSIEVPHEKRINISLEPQPVRLAEVVVRADEDPAYRIIREAIKRKKQNRMGLNNFEYNAYSKRIILSAEEVAVIEETFVKGYNKINKWEKEFIISTHKTENRNKENYSMDFSITKNYYIDFSRDTLLLINSKVYLPLADNAFDYYDYKLLNITESDEGEVYLIQVIPRSKIQPLLEGEITIENEMYAMNSINLHTNDGVRFPYINDLKIHFIQQLGKYDAYWLPHYIKTDASLKVNFGGLLTVETMAFNQVSSITEYGINTPIPDSIESAVRSDYGYFTPDTSGKGKKPVVLSREDINNLRPIPLAKTELEAYSELDSTKTLDKMIKVGGALSAFIPNPDEESDTTTSLIGEILDFITTYGLFRDNRVTGILMGARFDDEIVNDKLSLKTDVGYSFDRKKVEGKFFLNYKFKDFYFSEIEAGIFKYSKMWQIFTPYPDILNSLGVLLGFDDHFNYYLSTGFDIGIMKKISRSVSTELRFITEKQERLPAQKYKSIFRSNRYVRENPEIPEGTDNRISLSMQWGKNPMKLQVIPESGFNVQYDFSDPAIKSDFKYNRIRTIGMFKTKTFYKELFVSPYLQITIDAGLIRGRYGPQHTFTPNTSLAFYSPPGVFKGLKPYEFTGTEMIALHIEHNWRTIPFQAAGLDFISDMHIDLITGVSGLRIWNNSGYLTEYSMEKPYWEVYVGISRILALLRLDFAYNSQDEFSVSAAMAVIL